MKKHLKRYISAALTVILLCSAVIAVPIAASVKNAKQVIVGGVPFGIKLYTDGLYVVGVGDVETVSGAVAPARDAGIQKGDVIKMLNGRAVADAEEFSSLIGSASGEVEVTVERGGRLLEFTVLPINSSSDGKRKLGLWLRDSTAGIGTVTFIVPDTGEFAGLGHGVCNAETGDLIPLTSGTVADVGISGVKRGEAGAPGELKGYFTEKVCGEISKNTRCGVFGVFSMIPKEVMDTEKLPIGSREDLMVGEAYILCTVGSSAREKYTIEITDAGDSKTAHSFEIQVKDSALIEKTGGIVQGMSGSPIIQNGKLVGAVTHV